MAHMPLNSVRALVASVEAEERLMSSEVMRDPKWLVLPLAQRDALRKRHVVLERYDALRAATNDDVTRYAAEIGMKPRNFLRLYGEWASGGRTPLALVPYQGLRGDRRSKLADPGTADAIRSLISEALEKDPVAPPRKVIRHVKEAWSGPGDLPSDVTLRNFHDKAISERQAIPGTLTINFSNSPQEEIVEALTFGEVIVIDHTAPAKVLVDGDPPTAPTVTLAIDLWSGIPLGVATRAGPPSAQAAYDALFDAQRRLEEMFEGETMIRPKVLYASTFDRDWDNFRNWFLKHDFDLIERRDVRLHHGGPTKRIVGSKLGELQLQAKLAGRRSAKSDSVDVDTTALLTLAQIHHIADVAIVEMLSERLEQLEDSVGVWLDLPSREEIIEDWGHEVLVGTRQPRVEIDDILDRVRKMMGNRIVSTNVTEQDDERREYRVGIKIERNEARPSNWLDLAAEAVTIHKEHGVVIQFDLERADEPSPRGRKVPAAAETGVKEDVK